MWTVSEENQPVASRAVPMEGATSLVDQSEGDQSKDGDQPGMRTMDEEGGEEG